MAEEKNITEQKEKTHTSFHLNLKVVMLGEGAVGKTSLVTRYTKDTFSLGYKRTLGAGISVKRINIHNQSLALVIWDLAGQPSFKQMRQYYFSGAHGALLVFDVTEPQSYLTLENWYSQFRQVCPDGRIMIIANKIDLSERKVPKEAAQMISEMWKVPYVETSCLTGEGVQEAFRELAISILK